MFDRNEDAIEQKRIRKKDSECFCKVLQITWILQDSDLSDA